MPQMTPVPRLQVAMLITYLQARRQFADLGRCVVLRQALFVIAALPKPGLYKHVSERFSR